MSNALSPLPDSSMTIGIMEFKIKTGFNPTELSVPVVDQTVSARRYRLSNPPYEPSERCSHRLRQQTRLSWCLPLVISPLYRRMVDELLVELHLLSRQKGFQTDPLFAVGLVQIFDGFSRGYKPERHLEPLFEALCSSSGFDARQLRQLRDSTIAAIGPHSVDEVRMLDRKAGGGSTTTPG